MAAWVDTLYYGGRYYLAAGRWFILGSLTIESCFSIDLVAGSFAGLVVTATGIVNLFGSDYLAGDPAKRRFAVNLSAFGSLILVTVAADSLPLTFVGWEGIGLLSFLLIGH